MSQRSLMFFVLLFGGGVLAGAWAFQLLGGYQPCGLCLQQRVPYYLGLPIALFGLIIATKSLSPNWMKAIFALFVVVFGYGLFLAVQHAGVEWRWWLGPANCGAGDLSESLAPLSTETVPDGKVVVYCDEPALRVLGLSFAGWNAVASLILIIASIKGFFAKQSAA